MSKSKYYVVWKGKRPGIYTSWDDCRAQVHNVKGARYKSFKTKPEAIDAFRDPSLLPSKNEQPIIPSISVDAASSGNPGIMEYRAVDTQTGRVLFHNGPFQEGTNNIGEFLAIVHALAWMTTHGQSQPIYSDSNTGIGWVSKKAIKTTLTKTTQNTDVFALIDRAITWLNTHSVSIPILKWDTALWGEIPADFGRK